MKVAVCIASRGRPELLGRAVSEILEKAELPETEIIVALDDDDNADYGGDWRENPKIKISIAPREDSLGAKYNRAKELSCADVYVMWSDDVTIITPGWDRNLISAAELFPDGMGVIYFGKIPGTLQPGIAVTAKFIERMGFFCTPYFPFWWHDTWIDEVARLSGRIVTAPVDIAPLQDLPGKSRGVRDIAFWGQFFDALRPQRVEVARKIITDGQDPPFRKVQLAELIAPMSKMLLERNSKCSNPESAKELEKFWSFDAPADERYLRIKARAEAMLAGKAA